jgi:hypothetical protein
MLKKFFFKDNLKDIIIPKSKSQLMKEDFDNILQFADQVIESANENLLYDKVLDYSEHPIKDVMRILGRNVQSKYMSNLLMKADNRLEDIDTHLVFFSEFDVINSNGKTFKDVMIEKDNNIKINLCKDIIFPWPWSRERFVDCIASIGKGRFNGEWQQDNSNHYVVLWLPIGIAWVHGGNHSISTGIIQGVGSLVPKEVYDISEVYKYVYCDGLHYRRKENDSIICAVKNVEIAGIFEIGRKMIEYNIMA